MAVGQISFGFFISLYRFIKCSRNRGLYRYVPETTKFKIFSLTAIILIQISVFLIFFLGLDTDEEIIFNFVNCNV